MLWTILRKPGRTSNCEFLITLPLRSIANNTFLRLKNSVDADDVQIAVLSQALQETIEQATEHVEALFDKEWGTLTQKSKRKSPYHLHFLCFLASGN